jgi:hypothetical protein
MKNAGSWCWVVFSLQHLLSTPNKKIVTDITHLLLTSIKNTRKLIA